MGSISRPGRLALAVLLAVLVVADVVLLNEYALAIVLLAALLCLVLVAGSFAPFAESRPMLASTLVVQLLVVAVLSLQQYYVLLAIVALASVNTARLLSDAPRRPQRQ